MALQKVDYVNQVTVITAENMNDIQDAIIALETAPAQGLTEDVKQALLQLAQKVAYIDDQGQTYYDDLYNALYPPKTVVSITAVFDQGTTVIYDDTALNDLKQYLTVTAKYDDNTTSILPDNAYSLSGLLEAPSSTVTVLYNGVSTTFSVAVTARPTLSSITADYTQSGTVYPDDTLDSLKADLVVTAIYSDSSTQTVPAADYTLSGTLTAGTSTITVSYSGKTTTFSVTVTDVFPDTSEVTAVLGYIFDSSGSETSNADGILEREYLPVRPSTTYYWIQGPNTSVANSTYVFRVCYYDESKTFIERAASPSGYMFQQFSFTTPSNAAYIRLSWKITNEIGELSYDPELLDTASATGVSGYIFNASGEETSYSTGMLEREYFSVDPSTTYYWTANTIGSVENPTFVFRVCYYDESKTFIERAASPSGYDSPVYSFTTPSNAAYIRLSWNNQYEIGNVTKYSSLVPDYVLSVCLAKTDDSAVTSAFYANMTIFGSYNQVVFLGGQPGFQNGVFDFANGAEYSAYTSSNTSICNTKAMLLRSGDVLKFASGTKYGITAKDCLTRAISHSSAWVTDQADYVVGGA